MVIVEALDRIIATQDREISQNLSMILKKQGVTIHTSARVESMEQGTNGILVNIKKGEVVETLETDGVLVAVGRSPNTQGLFAEGLDLNLQRGFIPVNERYETQVPGIFMPWRCGRRQYSISPQCFSQGSMQLVYCRRETAGPSRYCAPLALHKSEIATVGLTADEAQAQGLDVKVGKFLMSANGKTMISMGERGFIKIVAESETEKVIGSAADV